MNRPVVCVVGLILSAVGFVTFTGLVAAAWIARAEANRQIAYAADRASEAADAAEKAIRLVREVIRRAEENLATARLAAAEQPPADPMLRILAKKATRELPGGMEQARDAVGTASDAVIVANAALEVLAELPADEQAIGVHPDRVSSARLQLDGAADNLRSAQRVLGFEIPADNHTMTPEQATSVQVALDDAKGFTGELDAALARARQRVDTLRRKARLWTLWAALGITAIGGLGAVGQVFLARASLRGLRNETV